MSKITKPNTRVMKLKKVTQIDKNIYEIIYVSGIFQIYKSKKVYPWCSDWRYLESGKKLPYSFGTALHQITQEIKLGDSYFTEPN